MSFILTNDVRLTITVMYMKDGSGTISLTEYLRLTNCQEMLDNLFSGIVKIS